MSERGRKEETPSYRKMYLVSSDELGESGKKGKRQMGKRGRKGRENESSFTTSTKCAPEQMNQTKVIAPGGRVNFYQNVRPPPSPFHRMMLLRRGRLTVGGEGGKLATPSGAISRKKKAEEVSALSPPPAAAVAPSPTLFKGSSKGSTPRKKPRGRQAALPPAANRPLPPPPPPRSQPQPPPMRQQYAAPTNVSASSAPSSSSINLNFPPFLGDIGGERRTNSGNDFTAQSVPPNEGVLSRGESAVRADLDELKEAVESMKETVLSSAGAFERSSADILQRVQRLHQNLLSSIDSSLEASLNRQSALRAREISSSASDIIERVGDLMSSNMVQVRALINAQSGLVKEQNALVLRGLREGQELQQQQLEQQQQQQQQQQEQSMEVSLTTPPNVDLQEVYSRISGLQNAVIGRLEELFGQVDRYQQQHISSELSRILGSVNQMNNADTGNLAILFRDLTAEWGQRTLNQLTSVQNQMALQMDGSQMRAIEYENRRSNRREEREVASQMRQLMGRMEAAQADFFERESLRVAQRNESLMAALRQATTPPPSLPSPAQVALPAPEAQASLTAPPVQAALPAPEGAMALPSPPSSSSSNSNQLALPAPEDQPALPAPSPTLALPAPSPSPPSSSSSGTSASGKRGEKRKTMEDKIESEISFSDSASDGEAEGYNFRRRSNSDRERRRKFNQEAGGKGGKRRK